MHFATSHIVIFVFTLIRYIQSCISSLCIFQVKSHPCLSARCQILYISTISAAGDLLYISIDLSFNFNLVLYFTCIFFFFNFHFTLELVIIPYVKILCSDIYVYVHVVITEIE